MDVNDIEHIDMKRTMEDEDDDEMIPAVWTLTSQSRNNNMVVADITNIDWSDVCGEAEITVSESAQGAPIFIGPEQSDTLEGANE